MNQIDNLDYLSYANTCMNSCESDPLSCEDRLVLAKISLKDYLEAQNPKAEFDATLLRLINLYRTSPLPRELSL